MSLYYRGSELRDIDDALMAEWVAVGNPKAIAWRPLPAQPVHDPNTQAVRWDGAEWIVETIPPPVPDEVESHKARIELIVRGEWSQILAIVDGMPEPQRSIAHEALYAPSYSRASPMLALLAQAMGWSAADVDERFAAAEERVV